MPKKLDMLDNEKKNRLYSTFDFQSRFFCSFFLMPETCTAKKEKQTRKKAGVQLCAMKID